MSEIPRIFVHRENISTETKIISIIDADDIHYLTKVQRIKENSQLIVLDNEYGSYSCRVLSIKKQSIEVSIDIFQTIEKYPSIEITLIQAFLPSNKMDFVIQKATELGVFRIILLHSDFSKTRLNSPETVCSKQKRLQKIAVESSKQSKRGKYPEIFLENSVDDILKKHINSEFETNFVCMETLESNKIKSMLKKHPPQNNKISIFIGPEGGWSLREKELFKQQNIVPISLGKNILRAETASIVMIGNLLYEYQFE